MKIKKIPGLPLAQANLYQVKHWTTYPGVWELETSDGKHDLSYSEDKVLWDQPQHVQAVLLGQDEGPEGGIQTGCLRDDKGWYTALQKDQWPDFGFNITTGQVESEKDKLKSFSDDHRWKLHRLTSLNDTICSRNTYVNLSACLLSAN